VKYLIIFIFFISFNAFSDEYAVCDVERGYIAETLETKYESNCGFTSGYVSGQSLVKNPQFELMSVIIPSKNKENNSLRIDFKEPVSYDFDQNYGCKTIECFNDLDHWEKLTIESPEFVKKVISSIPDIELYDIDKLYVENEIVSMGINSATPLFTRPPSGLEGYFTEVSDIDSLEHGILDGNLNEAKLEFKEKSPEYLEQFGDVEFVTDSDGNRIYINENSIQDLSEVSGDDSSSTFTDVEDRLNQAVVDSRENNEVKTEALRFTINDTSYEIIPLSENSKGVTFTISDGSKIQTFESPEFVFLEDFESIAELTFENGSIKFIDSFGIPYNLEAYPLGQEISLTQKSDLDPILSANGCLEALSTYLNNKDFSHSDVESFLKIQSSLTLHRLSWSQLNSNSPKNELEKNILNLIKQKYDGHSDIAKEFDQINIKSRNFLAKALPYVYEILNKQSSMIGNDTAAFKINLSDLKMIEILASFEELGDDNKWDHRQFETDKKSNNIVNYTTLINSAYKHSDHKIKSSDDIDKNNNFLVNLLPEMNKKLELQIKQIIFNSCIEQEGLSCVDSQARVEEVFTRDFDLIYSSLMSTISSYKDEDFLKNIEFSHLWPKVQK
jgi:hypothetical protein